MLILNTIPTESLVTIMIELCVSSNLISFVLFQGLTEEEGLEELDCAKVLAFWTENKDKKDIVALNPVR